MLVAKLFFHPPTKSTSPMFLTDQLFITTGSLVQLLWAVCVMISLRCGGHLQKKCRKCSVLWRMSNQQLSTATNKGTYHQTGQASLHRTYIETAHCTPTHIHSWLICNTHTITRLTFYISTSPSPSLYFSIVPEIPHKASKRADPEGLLHSHSQ